MIRGDRVREERERKGMTQTDLAERVGVHFCTISRIENGRRLEVSSYVLNGLRNSLNVSADWLLGCE